MNVTFVPVLVLLPMTLRAHDGRERRHIHVAQVEELLEQFLKLRAPAHGHLLTVIEHHLYFALAVFNEAEAADFIFSHLVLRLILPLVGAGE